MSAANTRMFFIVLQAGEVLCTMAFVVGIVLAFQKRHGLQITGRWIASVSAVLGLGAVFFPVIICLAGGLMYTVGISNGSAC